MSNSPAFPFEYHNQTAKYQDGFFGTGPLAPGASQQFGGMTLRDYFAAHCPITLAEAEDHNMHAEDSMEFYCKVRFEYADKMLAERAK